MGFLMGLSVLAGFLSTEKNVGFYNGIYFIAHDGSMVLVEKW